MSVYFDDLYKRAKSLDLVYLHRDGRAIIMLQNGPQVRLPKVAFEAMCEAGILEKDTCPYDKDVDIYNLTKPSPIAVALLGDNDPFSDV